jgi:ribosomal-protein-alanine N-acetyltransferase
MAALKKGWRRKMIWGKAKPQALFPDVHLCGFRILMRPPALEDWQQWASVREANIDHIQPFDPLWPENAFTYDLFQRRTHRQAREWDLGLSNAFLIFKNKGEKLIGGMNINNICRGAAQYAALGYWIDKDHEGRGYMAEALKMTLQYSFEGLGLHRVNASCLPHNTRSKNTLLKAGFKKEGFAEKYLQINGHWQDHELIGLPVEDWEKALKPARYPPRA